MSKHFFKLTILPLIILCIMYVVGYADIAYAQSQEKDFYRQGMIFALQGRFELAKQLFEKGLQVDHPFESPLKSSLVIIDDVMMNKVRKVAALHFFKATDLASRGEINNAIIELNKGIAQQPDYAMFYNSRGVMWSLKRSYDKAIRDFNHTLLLNPGYYKACLNRASTYSSQGLFEEAIADLNHALSINSRYPEAYFNRGVIYAQQDRFNEAIEDFTKAIALYAKYTLAYFHRGNAFAHQKRYEFALTDFNKVIELDQKLIEVYFNKALAFEKLKKEAEAIENYKIFIALAPSKFKKLVNSAQQKVEALEKTLNSGTAAVNPQ